MMSSMTTKLFIGCVLTSEIKMLLDKNRSWHIDTTGFNSELPLTKIHYQQKEYIGCFINKEKPSVNELIDADTILEKLIEKYCGQIKIKTIIFPQIFIA